MQPARARNAGAHLDWRSAIGVRRGLARHGASPGSALVACDRALMALMGSPAGNGGEYVVQSTREQIIDQILQKC